MTDEGASMREVVICERARTRSGAYGGECPRPCRRAASPVAAFRGLLERTAVVPDVIEDVILGHCYPDSEAPAIDGLSPWTPAFRSRSPASRSTAAAAVDSRR